jgi:hypothetical protein
LSSVLLLAASHSSIPHAVYSTITLFGRRCAPPRLLSPLAMVSRTYFPAQYFNQQLLRLLGQHMLILLGALGMFLLDYYQQFLPAIRAALLLALALGKGCYFLLHSFRSLATIEHLRHPFQRFLVLVSANLTIIVISYALDYFCLCKIYPLSFRGLVPGSDIAVFGQFTYLSISALACSIVGNIGPVTGPARTLLSAEVITGFVTTIFIISNFSNHMGSVPARPRA